MQSSSEFIGNIRKASRDLVRELGFMNRTIAGTDLSASAVHAIIEIGGVANLSAKQIAEKLYLEKSTVSRLIKSLKERNLVSEFRSPDDSRIKLLCLTIEGERALAEITRFGEVQVTGAIEQLDGRSIKAILEGLQSYSTALKSKRTQADKRSSAGQSTKSKFLIKTGYIPGIIGRVATMHALYYSRNNGFGAVFEAKVAGGMAEFMPRIGANYNQIWSVVDKGRILGAIAIDGESLAKNRGQLRWFIVDDELRGSGIGRELLSKAVEFCDEQGLDQTHLWTLKGLEAARKLYEDYGFKLVDEYYGEQWGPRVLEQKFIRSKL